MARFDCATWRPVANHGGAMSGHLGLVLHHAVADGSLYGWFNNPASQVSAHFWVAKSGAIEQYVDSDVVAWHGVSLNSRYCGVETEGCVAPPHAEPMTPQMVDALGRLYAEGARRHGWANAMANADGEPGLGFHRMAVQTGCPCDVRLNMRPDILARAFAGAGAGPRQEEIEMIMIRNSKGAICMFDGTKKVLVTEPTSAAAFKAAGIPEVQVTDAQFDRIPSV